tara:strand:- start:387 stop:854 length:468 start_codon:yes stop_codon:yes gene_type:complete
MDGKKGYLEHMFTKMVAEEPGVEDFRETERYQSYLNLLSKEYNILAETKAGFMWTPTFFRTLKKLAGGNPKNISDAVIESAIAEFINGDERLSDALPCEQTYFYTEIAKLAVKDGVANMMKLCKRKESVEDALWRITFKEVPDYLRNRIDYIGWT